MDRRRLSPTRGGYHWAVRLLRRKAPARRRRRIRRLRLLALLTVLGLVGTVAFGFGLVRAVASEIDAGKLDPRRQLDTQSNGYIYDSSGKRILAVLRGSEARTLVATELGGKVIDE